MHYVAGAVIKILRERALCHAALCCELEVTQDPGKNLNWSRILRAYDYYGGHYLRYRSRWRGNSSKGVGFGSDGVIRDRERAHFVIVIVRAQKTQTRVRTFLSATVSSVIQHNGVLRVHALDK